MHKRLYANVIKRMLDIVFSALALVILSPLLLAVAVLVRLKLGSPVIFRQPRPGMNERIFYIYKFRSMTNETGEDGRLLPDKDRLTRFGKIMRSLSLDELPELVNIIRGDMSIVGPRPLSIYYLPHYTGKYRRRHDVRPGLTGLAQVNGRNNLDWQERLDLDIRYVDGLSFALDMRIVLKTLRKVAAREDVTVRGTTKIMDYGPYCVLAEEKDGGRKMEGMTYSEIGSYFWLEERKGDPKRSAADHMSRMGMEDHCFAFSGRGAIYTALSDIMSTRPVNRVLMPSYCCVSMLQDFVDRGITVKFYDVAFNDGVFDYRTDDVRPGDVVLIMSYFGLDTQAERGTIEKLHDAGALIIEDITHSLLRDDPVSDLSDYAVCALRKWFPTPAGGWTGKKHGTIAVKPDMDSNSAVTEKIAGMREKYDYLNGRVDTKENYLLIQAKFENDLIHADRMLKIDDTSMKILKETDIDHVTLCRRRNAAALLEGIRDLEGGIMSIPKMDLKADVPLFIPVMMNTSDRDSLRSYLIDRGIYCPVHWPEVMGAGVGVRANELSLICDQRYSESDMAAIAGTIHEWVKEKDTEG